MYLVEALREVIQNKQIIEFTYNGLKRIADPHVLGIKNGLICLLVYQIGGQSSSRNLPNWRLVKIDKIINFVIINDNFSGKRSTTTGQHTDFDTILELVS